MTFGKSVEGGELVQKKILPALEQQKFDQDADVRYFATRALHTALGGEHP
jgi:serine/threonine-protein phosphatase 2A regulatory subunit A